MATRLYTFANGGLPSDDFLTASNFIAAIKAALVTGTSKKQAAGWKLVYESLSNPNDSSERIVVQSQSANSEQCYYEIIDGINAKLTVYELWDNTTNAGGGKSASVYINKITNWDGNNFILADEKFVWIGVTHVSSFFGDYDSYVNESKSIILGGTTTADGSGNLAIPSHNNNSNVGNRVIYDIDKRALCLRNYHYGWRGWTIAINYTTKYETYGNDDSAPYIKKVDILRATQGKASLKGQIPHLIYCDRGLLSGVTANNKNIFYYESFSSIGMFMFEVDEL